MQRSEQVIEGHAAADGKWGIEAGIFTLQVDGRAGGNCDRGDEVEIMQKLEIACQLKGIYFAGSRELRPGAEISI